MRELTTINNPKIMNIVRRRRGIGIGKTYKKKRNMIESIMLVENLGERLEVIY